MRRISKAVTIALILLGLAVTGAGVVESAVGTTQSAAPAQVLTVVPTTIGWTHTLIHWSGADGNTSVNLIEGSPHVAEFRYLCQAAPGLVVRGFGAAGSLTVTLSGGSTYSLYACTGSSNNPIYGIATTFTYAFTGLGYVSLAGIVICIGAALFATTKVRSVVVKLTSYLR